MKKFLSAMLMLVPCASLLAGISGTYNLRGFDPNINEEYTGTVVITKDRESGVYHSEWFFSNTTDPDLGTGLRVGDEISFVFVNSLTSGVQVYKIHGKNHLCGPWVNAGSNLVGKEEIKKIENSDR